MPKAEIFFFLGPSIDNAKDCTRVRTRGDQVQETRGVTLTALPLSEYVILTSPPAADEEPEGTELGEHEEESSYLRGQDGGDDEDVTVPLSGRGYSICDSKGKCG